MSRRQPVLRAEQVSVTLGGDPIVRNVTLELRAGEIAALIGPNGAGKTTLLRACAGLVAAEGRVLINERRLAGLSARERARLIAYLPQGHTFHWPITVAELVALGRQPYVDLLSRPSAADQIAIKTALAAAGIEPLAARSLATLSAGERARVALARALATQAPILLADEPTAALDPRHQLTVMQLLRAVAGNGQIVLAVVHDLALAARFADRVVIMHRGRLVADARPLEALTPERIADIFGVELRMVETDEGRLPMPRRPL